MENDKTTTTQATEGRKEEEKDVTELKELRVVVTRLSGSESDTSLMTVESESEKEEPARQWLKRPAGEEGDLMSLPKGVAHKSKRGRGRPPTTGEYVGLAAARERLNAAKEEELRLEVEEYVEGLAKTLRESRHACRSGLNPPTPGEDTAQSLAALNHLVLEAAKVVETVASKSRNLKGTSQKTLKDAAAIIKEAAVGIRARTVSEEVALLEAENQRLSAQLVEANSRPAATAPDTIRALMEEISRASVVQFSNMLNARLEGLECRLLPEPGYRPPLAADKKKGKSDETTAVAVSQSRPSGSGGSAPGPKSSKTPPSVALEEDPTPPAPLPAPAAQPQKAKGKGKGKGKKTAAAAPVRDASPVRDAPPPPPLTEQWSLVAARGAKSSGRQTATKSTQGKGAAAAVAKKLRAPKTAAVTLTLQPGAAERGASYATILREARTRIDRASLGIEEMRCRTTVTGARILEIFGDGGAEKADSLANKLREVLSADVVRVSRPTKRVDVLVSGLDDSVTAAEVVAAFAAQGGCHADEIRPGIVSERATMWLGCPVAAAKIVVGAERLKVGWITARVALLAARPLRCFKCLNLGHVASKCGSEVDRSGLCFRCGKPGHRARECRAEPNCATCAAAGKPAGHPLGGAGCLGDGKQAKAKRGTSGRNNEPTRSPSAEGPMETAS